MITSDLLFLSLTIAVAISNQIRHEKPFDHQSDFQEKLSEIEKILNNKTPLYQKREKKLSIQAEFAKVIGLVPAARAWECVPGKRL